MPSATKKVWQDAWDEWRSLVGQTFLGWAVQAYPRSSRMKLKLAQFIQTELSRELEEANAESEK